MACSNRSGTVPEDRERLTIAVKQSRTSSMHSLVTDANSGSRSHILDGHLAMISRTNCSDTGSKSFSGVPQNSENVTASSSLLSNTVRMSSFRQNKINRKCLGVRRTELTLVRLWFHPDGKSH